MFFSVADGSILFDESLGVFCGKTNGWMGGGVWFAVFKIFFEESDTWRFIALCMYVYMYINIYKEKSI